MPTFVRDPLFPVGDVVCHEVLLVRGHKLGGGTQHTVVHAVTAARRRTLLDRDVRETLHMGEVQLKQGTT